MNKTKLSLKKIFASQQFVAAVALIILYLFFYYNSVPFRSFTTLTSIFDSSYYLGFLAIGVTFVIATGGIDLSLGTGMIAAAITGGVLYERYNVPLVIALLVIVLFGILLGFFNGLLVAKLNMPPFIATLGTQMVTLGYGSMISKVQTVNFPLRSSPEGWYKSIFRTNTNFPTGIIVLLVLVVISSLFLSRTKPGRYILSLGSNEEATRLSGIDTVKYKWMAYVISGFFIGLAGIAYAATFTSVLPGEGMGIETNAIAGAIIGGTSMSGGIASVGGTIIGVFIMTVLQTGLPYIGFQPHYQIFITGFVIIGAVLVDVIKNKNTR
ncbi:ABC transporter permease [Fundicoccus culcitae]|uniref:ABC transporter permease n=1 Tax=Fundicoccus culcitae TaxID=2969821 RepID=A0ABY5P4Y9_9LACT|nr:ABC transporter permease [Fundicoccus culcitae]UUX33762.1 ABC transporter permease [Fundicoccus culcitae]